MNIINGGSPKIAGAKVGETVLIYLLSGKVEKGILNDVTRIGIEAFYIDLKNKPLTFYPFNTIVKVIKYIENE